MIFLRHAIHCVRTYWPNSIIHIHIMIRFILTSFVIRCNSYPVTQPSPWEIVYLDLFADFSIGSVDELSLRYDISVDREYETEIFEKDCETLITDIDVTLTGATRNHKDANHDTLVLAYGMDKSAIASSSLWNAASNQLELCQVVGVIIPATETDPKMVVVEDARALTIDFDLSVDFQFEADLEAEACQCDGVQSFTCSSSPLLPNQELFVCIWSVSSDMEIDFLDSMVSSIVTRFAFSGC